MNYHHKLTMMFAIMCFTLVQSFSQSNKTDTSTYFLYKSPNDFLNGIYDKGHNVKDVKGYQLENGREVMASDYWAVGHAGMLGLTGPEFREKVGKYYYFPSVFVCGSMCIYFRIDISYVSNPLRILEITIYDKQPVFVSMGLSGQIVEFDEIDKITNDPAILEAVKNFKYRSAAQLGMSYNVLHGFLFERMQLAIDYNKQHPTGKAEFNLADNITKDCTFDYER